MLTEAGLLPSSDQKLRFLAFPQLQDDHLIPSGWEPVNYTSYFDAIVISSYVSPPLIDHLFNRVRDHLIPVVSISPQVRGHSFDGDPVCGWETARAICQRLAELPQEIRVSSRAEDILLARLYSRATDLTAEYTLGSQHVVTYPAAGRQTDVVETANALVRQGCLTRRFFDKLVLCPNCGSSSVLVREECSKCRGSNIVEESILHHFKCGLQAPSRSFEQGDHYRCPRCSVELRHIGLDYDKPGSVVTCRSCAHSDDHSAVGFTCLACLSHHDTAAMPTKDWYHYQLTARGVQCLLQGHVPSGETSQEDLFTAMAHQLRMQRAQSKIPFQILRGRLTRADELKRRDPRLWQETLKLLGDALNSAKRPVDLIRYDDDGFTILMPDTDAKKANRAAAEIQTRVSEVLKADPGLECTLLNPTDAHGIAAV